jgi:hypothetical protein
MKVIKATDVPQSTTQVGEVNHSLVETLQQKFDALKQLLDTKSYGVFLDADLTKFALETFYPNVEWKGYESYAISETYEKLQGIVVDGALNGNTAVEINTPLLSIGQKPNSFKEYGLHSEQVKDLFDTIIDILNFGLIAGSTPVTINPALKSFFDSQIQLATSKIDNELIKQDKA